MSVSLSIDVHGCSVPEAMRIFIDYYNGCVRSGTKGFIEVVHGYGSSGPGGAIQRELRKFLAVNTDRLEMYVEGDAVGNPGITKVYPKKLLPIFHDSIGSHSSAVREALLRFCETPIARERVFTKLRGRFGDRVLRDEISRLVRDGLLSEVGGMLQLQ